MFGAGVGTKSLIAQVSYSFAGKNKVFGRNR